MFWVISDDKSLIFTNISIAFVDNPYTTSAKLNDQSFLSTKISINKSEAVIKYI